MSTEMVSANLVAYTLVLLADPFKEVDGVGDACCMPMIIARAGFGVRHICSMLAILFQWNSNGNLPQWKQLLHAWAALNAETRNQLLQEMELKWHTVTPHKPVFKTRSFAELPRPMQSQCSLAGHAFGLHSVRFNGSKGSNTWNHSMTSFNAIFSNHFPLQFSVSLIDSGRTC